jgi:hypothetical protein
MDGLFALIKENVFMRGIIEKINSRLSHKQKLFYALLGGLLLHIVFEEENDLLNYLINTSANPGQRTLRGLLIGLYGSVAYAMAGVFIFILIITPIVYFMRQKDKRNIYECVVYALYIGLGLRIYFLFT